MFPFNVVPSNVPLNVTSAKDCPIIMLITKWNFSPQNYEMEFFAAKIAAKNRSSATLAAQGSRDGAIGRHCELRGRFFRAFRGGIGQLPFTGNVALGKILGPFGLVDFKTVSIDKNHFYLCFFVE